MRTAILKVAQKNKVVDAVCRQRPCQPRILKSARAIRYSQKCTGFAREHVIYFTIARENFVRWRVVPSGATKCDVARRIPSQLALATGGPAFSRKIMVAEQRAQISSDPTR